jgi:hypothetical protein
MDERDSRQGEIEGSHGTDEVAGSGHQVRTSGDILGPGAVLRSPSAKVAPMCKRISPIAHLVLGHGRSAPRHIYPPLQGRATQRVIN